MNSIMNAPMKKKSCVLSMFRKFMKLYVVFGTSIVIPASIHIISHAMKLFDP